MSEIQHYFENKKVFLTGATGFLGKLLLEKLLRSCSKLRKIFLLLREKKGVRPQERLERMFNIPAYDELKAQYPNFSEKIEILNGDLERPYLGLSKGDIITLQENVEIVFHCGATVRFDETLKNAGVINVRATKHLIEICKKAKKLESLVYVSTAYSNCSRNYVEERIYDPYLKAELFLDIIDSLDDNTLEKITPILLRDLPNTYVLSKGAAEHLIYEEAKDLPISIVRPSIVISSFKEPVEGWADTMYNATGLLTAGGLGLLRSMNGSKEKIADLVPADFVVNNIIATAWDTHRRRWKSKERDLKIFTVSSGSRNPITWGQYYYKGKNVGEKYPLNAGVWYPFSIWVASKYIHALNMFLFHTVPALLIDFILILLFKKPMMLNVVEKMKKISEAVSFFTRNEWSFDDKNTVRLYNDLSEADKTLFPFDVATLKWDDYFDGYIKGIRVYLVKDPMDTLPAAKRRFKILFVVHYATVTILLYLLYKLLLTVCSGLLGNSFLPN